MLKFGVLAPSTNTVVEPDFYKMSTGKATGHFGRIMIHDQDLSSDEKMKHLLVQIREEILRAIDRVQTAGVDALVMGMSAETFWGGLEGSKEFVSRLEDHSGLKVYCGSASCAKALQVLNAGKIGVLTPYQPIADENVKTYFNDIGVEVTKLIGLRCPTARSIAEVPEDKMRESLIELSEGADAIVQVGTNLSMLRLADEAERWLGKPVVAINAATWWYAHRMNGIKTQLEGCGKLWREY